MAKFERPTQTPVAPIRRKVSGAFMPKTVWLLNGESSQLVPGTLDRASINEQLAALKKAIFERALGAELTHHLGYEKGDSKPEESDNHRNGSSVSASRRPS